jgi:hypothetical protein
MFRNEVQQVNCKKKNCAPPRDIYLENSTGRFCSKKSAMKKVIGLFSALVESHFMLHLGLEQLWASCPWNSKQDRDARFIPLHLPDLLHFTCTQTRGKSGVFTGWVEMLEQAGPVPTPRGPVIAG